MEYCAKSELHPPGGLGMLKTLKIGRDELLPGLGGAYFGGTHH